MNVEILFNCLLVPTDFSPNSWTAFQYALGLVDRNDSEIVVVHAIDVDLVNQIVQFGFGDHNSVLDQIKRNARSQLQAYSDVSDETTRIDTLVCEGEPFFEIIQKSDNFAVDAIVMSKFGQSRQPKSLLFGSTAEKVIRGSKKPVIVLPIR